MTKNELVLTLRFLRPNAEWNLRGNEYAGLEWLDKIQPKPSEQELAENLVTKTPEQLEWVRLKTAPLEEQITFLAKKLNLE